MNTPEIDFLMEQEYALQAQLDRIRERLTSLLMRETVVPIERHLHVVQNTEGIQ